MLNIKAFLENLTHYPGVYQMLDKQGEVLYVGKACNLKKRLSSYFSSKQKDNKTLALIKHVVDIHVTVTHSENDALLLECNLIKKYKPHYNILFRDDKSYPYILIKNETPYPSIELYRGNKQADGTYFGPYPSATAVRETIHLIQKLFGLRLSNDKYSPTRKRPCLQYQINLCSGSCAGLVSPEDYRHDVQHAVLFLQGKNQQILHELSLKMEDFSKEQRYEEAANIRNQIAMLREIQARQYISSDRSSGDVDVIGVAAGDTACIQLLMIRGGRMLGSRAYFTSLPAHSTTEEVVASFITQHYQSNQIDKNSFPREIIVDVALRDRILISNALSQLAGRKTTIHHHVRSDRKKWQEIANASAKESISRFLLNKANIHEKFLVLETLLENRTNLNRIECFDISHTMGEATVASCVVFNKEGPLKMDYRRFNIKGITPGDDVAAMHQVLSRRYQRLQTEHAKLPDLILIDGGPTQLSAATKIIHALQIPHVMLIGVAKGKTRKPGFETLYFENKEPMHLPSDSLALHLIQQIRDEAHRFAITGHRQQRDKSRNKSILESIPGIGAKRRRDLLQYFGGIQSLNRASLDELAKVPGINQSLAKRIFAALHKTTA